MDEQMKERLESYLDTIEQSVGTASEFTMEQAPLLAQEVVRYTLWSNLIGAITCLVLALIVILVARVLWKLTDQLPKSEADVAKTPLVIFGVFFFVACVVGISYYVPATLKAAVAPRLVIVEEVSRLVK